MKRKFSITFDDGTHILKSAVIECENIVEVFKKFDDKDSIIGIVEINHQPKAKAVTMRADLKSMTLLRSGSLERIINIDSDSVETDKGKYNIECIKMI